MNPTEIKNVQRILGVVAGKEAKVVDWYDRYQEERDKRHDERRMAAVTLIVGVVVSAVVTSLIWGVCLWIWR